MKRIDMLVVLENGTKKFYDRLGLDEVYEEFQEKNSKSNSTKGKKSCYNFRNSSFELQIKMMEMGCRLNTLWRNQKIIAANRVKQGDSDMNNDKLLPVRKLKMNLI